MGNEIKSVTEMLMLQMTLLLLLLLMSSAYSSAASTLAESEINDLNTIGKYLVT